MSANLSGEGVRELKNYIVDNHNEFLTKCLEKLSLDVTHEFYSFKYRYGKNILELLLGYITNEKDYSARLKEKVKEMVYDRDRTDVPLNNLIQCVNVCRRLLLQELSRVTENSEQLLEYTLLLNEFYDGFIDEVIIYFTAKNSEIIREKNQFIQEMHHDRLTIVSKIATSFAHEFRNPLTSIKGFLYLLDKRFSLEDPVKSYFKIMDKEIDSLEKKITQFLYLSKIKGLDDLMETFDLSELIQEMIQVMFPRFLGETIQVRDYVAEGLIVFGVKEQIKQVVLNIFNNAVEELMESNHERFIEVSAQEKGEDVIIEISNNGRMIPKHILDNIFEPFISTKELGTGLGLSVCRQIVDKHSGTIQVNSKKGKTTFMMILPKIEKSGNFSPRP